MIRPFADESGVLVLAIDSRADTWDILQDEIGPDVASLDRALQWTFDRFTVDRSHMALSGFSDGASYALSIGLANGDFFPSVIAFSPGFSGAPELHGRPRLFIAHGSKVAVLPIDRCSRRLVRRLRREGYVVEYREFDGPHTVPPVVELAVAERSVVDGASEQADIRKTEDGNRFRGEGHASLDKTAAWRTPSAPSAPCEWLRV